MNTSEIDTKKSTELTTSPSVSGLISFDEFDNYFDDFILR